MNSVLLILYFSLAVLLEGTLFWAPLSLLLLLNLFIKSKSPKVYVIALIVGIILDILRVQVVGLSSLFFLIFLFFVHLYDRKYEINTLPFVLISACVCALVYSLIFIPDASIINILISTAFGGIMFYIAEKINLTIN